MNVLLIGSGGREHALAVALRASPRLAKLFAAPGNPGIAALADRVALDVADHGAVIDFCRLMAVDLVVVGPEVPLVAGITDDLTAVGIAVFGPSAAAARLEGSKAFTKAVCDEANVPTARWSAHTKLEDALADLARRGAPIVVKADGLAAGKGVTVAPDAGEAEAAIRACFADGEDGGARVVLEDVLRGEEASVFCVCDGEVAIPLPPCRDHKRVGDGDTGPNTGGMGAVCPAPLVTREVLDRTMERIVRPTLRTMAARGTPFRGVLYAGLMIEDGEPSLIEYNVRFGDPEAQVLLPLLGAQALDLIHAAALGDLADARPPTIEGAALCVTLAAANYPATPRTGDAIEGLADAEVLPGVSVFHAGTREDPEGTLRTAGGRVLTVTGRGATLEEARDRAYRGVGAIRWPGMHHRRDIGARDLGG